MKVFVYGTLKKGYGLHHAIQHCEYLGKARTSNDFTMYHGAYPYLVKQKGRGAVGEVYEVDEYTLRNLDRIEGHPTFYERTEITVDLEGSEIPVYAYLIPKDRLINNDLQIIEEF